MWRIELSSLMVFDLLPPADRHVMNIRPVLPRVSSV